MALTPVLGITQVATNQSNKEVTINDAILALEGAGNASLDIDFTLGTAGTYTLDEAVFTRNYLFRCLPPPSGTTAGILKLPHTVNGHSVQRIFVVKNASGVAITVVIDGAASGTTGANGLLIADGASRLVVQDGDTLDTASDAVTTTRFTDLIDAPHSYVGKANTIIRVNVTEDGLEFAEGLSLESLSDVDSTGQADGSILRYVAGTGKYTAVPLSLVTTFLGLSDVPHAYTASGGYLLRVNAAVNAVEFVNPASLGGPVTGGGNTHQILTKLSATDGDYAWEDAPVALPVGGTTNQILKKNSATDGDAGWEDAPVALPAGGTTGQLLRKSSATAGDAAWAAAPISLPTGGTLNQVLTKASATDGDATWLTPTGGGGGGPSGYLKGFTRVHLAADKPVVAGTWTPIPWDAEDDDTLNCHATNDSDFIAPAGVDVVRVSLEIAWAVGVTSPLIKLINSTTSKTTLLDFGPALQESGRSVSTIWLDTNAGDHWHVEVNSASIATLSGASGTNLGAPCRAMFEWAARGDFITGGTPSLATLSDVDETTPPTNGQALVYNTSESKWKPGTVSGGGGTPSLATLSDVDETTPPTNGQALVYNTSESKWKPGTVSGGGGSTTPTPPSVTAYTHTGGPLTAPTETTDDYGYGLSSATTGLTDHNYWFRTRTASGDQTLITRIQMGTQSGGNNSLGIVLRDSTTTSFLALLYTWNNGVYCEVNKSGDDGATGSAVGSNLALTTGSVNVPCYLRATFVSASHTTSFDVSLNGVVWHNLYTGTGDLTAIDQIGFIARSQGSGAYSIDGAYQLLSDESIGFSWGAGGGGGGATTLAGLTDVDETTLPIDGQSLVYNSATSKWNPRTITSGGVGSNPIAYVFSNTAASQPTFPGVGGSPIDSMSVTFTLEEAADVYFNWSILAQRTGGSVRLIPYIDSVEYAPQGNEGYTFYCYNQDDNNLISGAAGIVVNLAAGPHTVSLNYQDAQVATSTDFFSRMLKIDKLSSGGGSAGGNNFKNAIDKEPYSPSAFNDEFTGTTLDPSWTWVNQTSSGATASAAVFNSLLRMTTDVPISGQNTRYLIKDRPVGDFDVIAKARFSGAVRDYNSILLGTYNTTSGKASMSRFTARGPGSVYTGWIDWNSPTSSATETYMGVFWQEVYLRLRCTGGVVTYMSSNDGIQWQTNHSDSETTGFVGVFDKICLAIGTEENTNPFTAIIDWIRDYGSGGYVEPDLGL